MRWKNDEFLGGIEGCVSAIQAADPDFGECLISDFSISCAQAALYVGVFRRFTSKDLDSFVCKKGCSSHRRLSHIWMGFLRKFFFLSCSYGSHDQHRPGAGGHGELAPRG